MLFFIPVPKIWDWAELFQFPKSKKSFPLTPDTGEVQEDLLKEHTSAFLEMGEMYELNELKDMAEKTLLSQLDKENMVKMIYIGELFRAEDIFEAALKMTKINMTWLRNQVIFNMCNIAKVLQ